MPKEHKIDEEKIIESLREYQMEKMVRRNLTQFFREIVLICESADAAGLSSRFIYEMAMHLVLQHFKVTAAEDDRADGGMGEETGIGPDGED